MAESAMLSSGVVFRISRFDVVPPRVPMEMRGPSPKCGASPRFGPGSGGVHAAGIGVSQVKQAAHYCTVYHQFATNRANRGHCKSPQTSCERFWPTIQNSTLELPHPPSLSHPVPLPQQEYSPTISSPTKHQIASPDGICQAVVSCTATWLP